MGVCLHRNARLTGSCLLHYSAVLRKQTPLTSRYVVSSAVLVEDHEFDEIPEAETWKPAATYVHEGGSCVFEVIPEVEAWKHAVMYRRGDRSHVFDGNPEVEAQKPAVTHGHKEKSKHRLFSLVGRVLKSLNWEVAWRIRFQRIVNEHGFEDSMVVLWMMVQVFAIAGMRLEVYALLRDIVCYFKESNVDMLELTNFLLDMPADVVGLAIIYNVLIKVFAANSMLTNAEDLFITKGPKSGLQPDVYSSNFLLKCLVEADREVSAGKLFDIMKNRGPAPNSRTYTIMLNSLSKLNLSQDVFRSSAFPILEDMAKSGISCTVVTYGTFIHGLCKVGAIGVALDFIRRLQNEDQPLNHYCFNAVIRGFCQEGQLSEALEVLDEMRNYGVSPDVYSYSILINGFCKRGDVEKSLSLFHEMEVSNIKPTVVSYSSLCHCLCKAGLMELSHGFFRDIGYRGYEYDYIAYDILVDGFINQGHVGSASRLLQEMINHNVFPCASTFTNIGEGNSEEALKLNQHIFRTYDMYTTVINGLCKEGKPEKAWELLAPMLKKNIFPDVVICSILMDGFAKNLKLKKARKLYGKMIKAGITPDMVTNTILINVLCGEGHMCKAYTLFTKMIEKGLAPDNICYTSIIAGFCRLGQITKAWVLFKKMLERKVLPSVVTFTCLIDGFSKQGRMDLAEPLFDEMKRRGVDPDIVTYKVLVAAYHRSGNMKKKEEMLLEMQQMCYKLWSG